MSVETYRILEDGEQLWVGLARSPEQAEEKCFDDESPTSIPKYSMDVLRKVKITNGGIKSLCWVSIYKNATLKIT